MDQPQSVTRALVNMVGAAIAFSILNVAVKSLRSEIPDDPAGLGARRWATSLFVIAAVRAAARAPALRGPSTSYFSSSGPCSCSPPPLFYFTAIGFVALATAAAISFS